MAKNIIKYCLFFILAFLFLTNASFSAQVKIQGIDFDSSDNMIFIKSDGDFMPKVPLDFALFQGVAKGYLSNPTRVFFDIPNAILTTPSRTYTLKNSAIEEATISQFSNNPAVVRIVLKYNKAKLNQNNPFSVYKNYNQLIIKYSNKLVLNDIWHYVYNSPQNNFSGLISQIKNDSIQSSSDLTIQGENYERKLKTDFRIESIKKIGDGILIRGYGFLAFKPAMFLTEPNRMVVDIQNATIESALQNKSVAFSTLENKDNLAPREILRIAQFDKNTVRLVVQGQNALDYSIVSAPDGQSIFIAKNESMQKTTLTENLASILRITPSLEHGTNVLGFDFDNPVSLSFLEKNKNLFIDIQNILNSNDGMFEELKKNNYYSNIKTTKLSTDKMRIQIPIKDNVDPLVRMAQNGSRIKIYFNQIQTQTVQTPKTTPKETQKVVATKPKTKTNTKISPIYKVVIDPGHGGGDTGATRFFVDEKDINLSVSKLLQEELNKQKIYTYLTRDNDVYITLEERVLFSEEIKPDVYVSVHVNASTKDEIYGLETHWYREESFDLAKTVHKKMTSEKNLKKWNTINRGLFKSQFYVINHTTAPAILVEIGFISNEAERTQLQTKERQEEVAKAIADGIVEYLKQRSKVKK